MKSLKRESSPTILICRLLGITNKALSYSSFLTADQLSDYRRSAYYSFFLSRAIYHPLAFSRIAFNVVRGAAETKTESYLRTFIRRHWSSLTSFFG